MGSPFAPRSSRPPLTERAPDVPPISRLTRAGLRPGVETDEVERRWAAMSNAERLEVMHMLTYADNEELALQIEDMRAELAEEAASSPLVGAVGSPPSEAVPEGTAAAVLEWVGDNPTRAEAALEAEQAGQGRTTLLRALERLARRG